MISSINPSIRVIFTDGGKGGVGRTEVAVHLTTWMGRQGIVPKLIDFGGADRCSGCLKSFFPDALRVNPHDKGSLDHFFEVLGSGSQVVIADTEAGVSSIFSKWLTRMGKVTRSLNIKFTALGVTVDEPDAIDAIRSAMQQLQGFVDYVVVLNEIRQSRHGSREVSWNVELEGDVREATAPVIRIRPRNKIFQAKVRTDSLTLEDIIKGHSDEEYFRYLRNIAKARRYLRQAYREFDSVSQFLLPEGLDPKQIVL